MKRVLRYINSTHGYGLHYGRDTDFTLHGFTDSNWSGDVDGKRSTTDIAFHWALHIFHSSLSINLSLLMKLNINWQMQPLRDVCGKKVIGCYGIHIGKCNFYFV